MLGVSNYYVEVYPKGSQESIVTSDVTFRSCTVGERLRCIFVGTFAGIGIGAGVGIATGSGLGPVGAVTGAAIGGTIGGLIGLGYGIFTDDCCTPDVSCFAVEGITLRFTAGCAPVASYTAFGFGPDDVSLFWTNVGGTPGSLTTPTSLPRATITQTSSSTPVNTTFVSVCLDGSTNPSDPFLRNLSSIVNSILSVNLLGADQIAPGETYTYTGLGISLNSNYSTRWFVNGGTIVSSDRSSATVEWGGGFNDGWIQMEVTNDCSGLTEVFTLNVSGDGPIP